MVYNSIYFNLCAYLDHVSTNIVCIPIKLVNLESKTRVPKIPSLIPFSIVVTVIIIIKLGVPESELILISI